MLSNHRPVIADAFSFRSRGRVAARTGMASSAEETKEPCLSRGLTRWYMDMRGLSASTSSLPLLFTLQPDDQEAVKRFYHLADRHMSLASCLLKYLFIHRTCHVPWSRIVISRTPAPHKRPCYIPLPSADGGENKLPILNVEFNVSHQASLVALAGYIIPGGSPTSAASATNTQSIPSPTETPATPQVGIDITCTDERARRGKSSIPTTEVDLCSFIDIYAEVFSPREIEIMKSNPTSQHSQAAVPLSLEGSIQYRLRRFYTYWALKEAYIKMTGEALLAPWLRQLEFVNVNPPEPAMDGERPAWGSPRTDVQVWMYGQKVENVRIETVSFGKEYVVATATRGPGLGTGLATWGDFRSIDIDADVAPCALGKCQCPK
ncbi:4'-phosphopantetheinyl transferase NpgA [Coccidioides immitis RS]|uniref:holo-[acyl-carrier-protein] synthase n=1 Tax=Coccidioides immitis (strain RS) TaxID=246410 RepID=J3KHV1_COCIM|nr:4'-phosphopantetheinyl transferase NpgA [Coccidioides immitis RS]EAS35481.3 4'-phosphopantetheinyl transferase NpgA [Coccidioides immitis RS]